jgi:hypothetical protein
MRWELCEEYRSQMWKAVPIETRDGYIQQSADLMRDYDAFEKAMKKAVDDWPNSSACALTASTINHQAWIGHAGCAINHDAPEDLTRLAWRTLTQSEQDAANAAADRAIEYWASRYQEQQHAKTRTRD